jgi:hypothetical protein
MGIEMARADTFKVEHDRERKTKKFERVLRLTDMALTARNEYDRHRKVHSPNS